MNSLSQLLYLGDLAGSLSGLFGTVAVGAIVGGVTTFCIGGANKSNGRAPGIIEVEAYHNEDRKYHITDTRIRPADEMYLIGVYYHKWTVALAVISAVFGLAACVIPSKETVYLIAASQAGEKVVSTDTGNKALAAIDRYLDSIGKKDDK